jgi:hypothetical protein
MECLWPKIEVASRDARTPAQQVQFESVEAQGIRNDLIHGAPRMNIYRAEI